MLVIPAKAGIQLLFLALLLFSATQKSKRKAGFQLSLE
jgi:hypothetical protein